jgi:hypothetical protein
VTESATFTAQVARVQTLADGGLRVTLDLPEHEIEAAAMLMAFKVYGKVGRVTYAPVDEPEKQVETGDETGGVEKGPKRKSKWKAPQKQNAHDNT